jgi:hypothetical protein
MEDSHRSKRGPPEPVDDLDPVKRQRLGADSPPPLKVPPLPEGPVSFDQLFTLTEDVGLSSFDVKQLPADMIVNITVAVLSRVDPSALSQAIEVSSSQIPSKCFIPFTDLGSGYTWSISNLDHATGSCSCSPCFSRGRR